MLVTDHAFSSLLLITLSSMLIQAVILKCITSVMVFYKGGYYVDINLMLNKTLDDIDIGKKVLTSVDIFDSKYLCI